MHCDRWDYKQGYCGAKDALHLRRDEQQRKWSKTMQRQFFFIHCFSISTTQVLPPPHVALECEWQPNFTPRNCFRLKCQASNRRPTTAGGGSRSILAALRSLWVRVKTTRQNSPTLRHRRKSAVTATAPRRSSLLQIHPSLCHEPSQAQCTWPTFPASTPT
mgnify:CR=1 FL=1